MLKTIIEKLEKKKNPKAELKMFWVGLDSGTK